MAEGCKISDLSFLCHKNSHSKMFHVDLSLLGKSHSQELRLWGSLLPKQKNNLITGKCHYVLLVLPQKCQNKLKIKDSGLCLLGNRNEERGQKRRPEGESFK